MDSTLIGAHDKIKLHGAEAALPRAVKRMRAHGAGHTLASCARSGHISAIGDMAASALLVGAQIVCSEDLAIFPGNEHLVLRRIPILEGLFAGKVARKCIRFSVADDWFKDLPYHICILQS